MAKVNRVLMYSAFIDKRVRIIMIELCPGVLIPYTILYDWNETTVSLEVSFSCVVAAQEFGLHAPEHINFSLGCDETRLDNKLTHITIHTILISAHYSA